MPVWPGEEKSTNTFKASVRMMGPGSFRGAQ